MMRRPEWKSMKNCGGAAVAGLNRSATRTVRGAISFNSSIHLPPTAGSLVVKPVMLPPGRARLAAKPLPIGSATTANTIGIVRVSRASAPVTGVVTTEDRVGSQIDQLFCERLDPIRITGAPAKFDPEIAAFRPPQLRERIPERRDLRLRSRIALRKAHQHADQPHPFGLLRTRRDRPCRRAAEECDELAPPHGLSLKPKGHTLPHRRVKTALCITAKLAVDDRLGSFTTDAFSTRADQCPLLLQ